MGRKERAAKKGRLRIENAAELLEMRKELEKIGIELSISTAYILQSNSRAKQTNRSMMDITHVMTKRVGHKEKLRG